MSTPYNDQWLIGRSRWRRRGRAAVGGALGPATAPLEQPPDEGREPQDKVPAEQPAAFKEWSGAMRPRPRWIDRDT